MPIHNAEIAGIFNRLADLLEIEGANQFRVRAYRTAAQTIGSYPHSITSLVAEGDDLSMLPGIGKDLAGKIAEIARTGHLCVLDEIEKRFPEALIKLTALPGLGPKRVKALYEKLNITSLESLAEAARTGKVRKLKGFGKKTEARILAEIDHIGAAVKRTRLIIAEQLTEPLVEHLKKANGVKQVIVAGSYRRRRENVGDADILVTCSKGSDVIDRFVSYEDVDEVVSKGTTRSTVLLESEFQVDLRVVPQVSYGAALHYFTGSKTHSIAIRTMAVKRGLKINEYGVFKDEKRVAGRTEEEVYAQVDLPYIEPELRENRGEIEAAQMGRLPKLVTEADIRGDLHAHTKASDGMHTVAEMAEAARKRGYAYLGITDHTKRVTVAHGLDARRLAAQIDEIDRINDSFEGFRILKSAEVEILDDSSLDLPDDVLRRLDYTVCAVHYKFGLSLKKQTERIIRAMDNPNFTILAHPTGRLLGKREPYEVDMEHVIEAARERGCFLEVNAQPDRLDLNDIHCKLAKEIGVKIAISTDAHSIANLDFMRFGINQARRGWLEREDVLNTRNWCELKALFDRG